MNKMDWLWLVHVHYQPVPHWLWILNNWYTEPGGARYYGLSHKIQCEVYIYTRDGDWDLYLLVFRKMIPFFFNIMIVLR